MRLQSQGQKRLAGKSCITSTIRFGGLVLTSPIQLVQQLESPLISQESTTVESSTPSESTTITPETESQPQTTIESKENPDFESGTNMDLIVGIVIAIIVLVLLLGLVIALVVFIRKRKASSYEFEEMKEVSF